MEWTTLDRLKWGEKGIIEKIDIEGPAGYRLMEMGLLPGTRVELRGRAPMGDPLRVRLRTYSLTLRMEDARGVSVRRIRP